MENGKWKVESGKWGLRMESGEWKAESGNGEYISHYSLFTAHCHCALLTAHAGTIPRLGQKVEKDGIGFRLFLHVTECKYWYSRQDLNLRLLPSEGSTLSTELREHESLDYFSITEHRAGRLKWS